MTKLILALLALSTPAHAGQIFCAINPQYTNAKISWDDTYVTIGIENPQGYKGMPQFEAPMAPQFIPMMEMQAKDLAPLGDRFTYRWKRELCKITEGSKLLSCNGRSEPQEGIPEALSLTTAQIDETTNAMSASTYRIRFIIASKNFYFLAIPFPLQFCKQSS